MVFSTVRRGVGVFLVVIGCLYRLKRIGRKFLVKRFILVRLVFGRRIRVGIKEVGIYFVLKVIGVVV